ncbi:AraC family transcriptional regulator [Iamia sp. SCSIO 61187]|uniref:AraC family transcriptional regulator n=1 Tax=Iamia sp. SCSIO 61187 TaxID=2722752 RepID=UPI001C6324D2|nr:AraC family transcriptional regulator [Iamia sp. SCSIO 61187]QYG95158.1 AraC family transcriptional regulator [Iamia sp. SCSIO 61187]
MDALDIALASVRVESALVGRSMVEAPWGLRMDTGDLCVLVAVVRDEAWVRHGDGAPVHLEEGTVAVACGGVPVEMGDHPDTPPEVRIVDQEDCYDTVTGENVAGRDRTGARTWGDPDASGSVILSAYRAHGEVFTLLERDLPPLLVVPPDPLVAPVLAALAAETQVDRPGGQVVVDRLMELLLFASIRAWLASSAAAAVPSWSTALADPMVGPALSAMHADPARRWTVADLAAEAAVSRAAFARRFRERVGEPPLAHLTRWRMALAADALRAEPGLDLTAVAARVGYADAFSFSTAFRRVRGQTPSQHRRSA